MNRGEPGRGEPGNRLPYKPQPPVPVKLPLAAAAAQTPPKLTAAQTPPKLAASAQTPALAIRSAPPLPNTVAASAPPLPNAVAASAPTQLQENQVSSTEKNRYEMQLLDFKSPLTYFYISLLLVSLGLSLIIPILLLRNKDTNKVKELETWAIISIISSTLIFFLHFLTFIPIWNINKTFSIFLLWFFFFTILLNMITTSYTGIKLIELDNSEGYRDLSYLYIFSFIHYGALLLMITLVLIK